VSRAAWKARPRREEIDALRAWYEELLQQLRPVARALGYALTAHGSLERDLELVAVPWTSTAAPARELAFAIGAAAGAEMHRLEAVEEYFQEGSPGSKPHGRLVWTFHLGPQPGPYIDLSVMPRSAG
jgi:hypothetical protein